MIKLCFPLLVLILFSCSQKKQVVKKEEFSHLISENLLNSSIQNTKADLLFWENKMEKDNENFVNKLKAASAHLKLFHLSGTITNLLSADSLLKAASASLNNKDPEILFAISQNAITQHRFKEAVVYNNDALKVSGDPYIHSLLEFDGQMELGNLTYANKILSRIENKTGFEYLIRKAKLEDQWGNTEKAIRLMQEAFKKIETKSTSLFCWTLSNLGDMYSHSGRVEEAYNAYLGVLQKDSSYLYAVKGIAWLAYSNDKNCRKAKQILNNVLTRVIMPDLWLQMAEMEEWLGNKIEKKRCLEKFILEITKPEYKNMYNKYLILLYCDEFNQPGKALSLALKEIENRATAETYSWLAWAYLNNGENQKALSIVQNYVYGKTFEPEILYHTAFIFSKCGKRMEAKQLLKDCLTSYIELGPVKIQHIKEKIKKIEES